ncbi:MAG TPA: ribbon-helix-helix domain-containing protein [Candidatus Dormibacteraeota bacterium]|nr:ribbon-helix-helix domain-containing protein [Candidatus Dormibacteraeota bacterium]
MARINLTIADDLLKRLDEVAKNDYTSRSDIIRQAILFYFRSTAKTISRADRKALLKDMKSRQLQAHLNKAIKRF